MPLHLLNKKGSSDSKLQVAPPPPRSIIKRHRSFTDFLTGHALNGFHKILSVLTACQLTTHQDYATDPPLPKPPKLLTMENEQSDNDERSEESAACVEGASEGHLGIHESGIYIPKLRGCDVHHAAKALVDAVLLNVAAMGNEYAAEIMGNMMQSLVEVAYSELAEKEFAGVTLFFLQRGLILSTSEGEDEPVVMLKVWKALKFLEEPLQKMTKRSDCLSIFVEAAAIVVKVGLFLEVLRSTSVRGHFEYDIPLQYVLEKYEKDLVRIMQIMHRRDLYRALSIRKKSPTSRPFSLPFARNPLFRGREIGLADMYTVLHGQSESPLAPTSQQTSFDTSKTENVICVVGEEGVGKTEFVVEYAYRHLGNYDGVLWVDAHMSCAEESFAALAGILDIKVDRAEDVKVQMHQVMEVLESGERFLLILDNVEEEKTVEMLTPQVGETHTIVTSCLKLEDMPKYRLKGLSIERAKQVLAGSRPYSKSDQALMGEIATELEQLPLALVTASRLLGAGLSPSELLVCLQKEVMELFGHTRIDRTFQRSSNLQSLFIESLQQLKRSSRPESDFALAIFQVGGFFGPHPIPSRLLAVAIQLLRHTARPISAESLLCEQAFELLSSLNLARLAEGGRGLLIHPVMQAFSRSQDRDGSAARAVGKAMSNALCFEDTVGHFSALWERHRADFGKSLGLQREILAASYSLLQYKLWRQKSGEARNMIQEVLNGGKDIGDGRLDFWYLNVEGPLLPELEDVEKTDEKLKDEIQEDVKKEGEIMVEKEKQRREGLGARGGVGERGWRRKGEGQKKGFAEHLRSGGQKAKVAGDTEGEKANVEGDTEAVGHEQDEEESATLLDKVQFLQEVKRSERWTGPLGVSIRCRQLYHKVSLGHSSLADVKVEWRKLRVEAEALAKMVKPRNLSSPYGGLYGINWEDYYVLDAFVDLSFTVATFDQYQDDLLQLCHKALMLAECIFPLGHYRIRGALWNLAFSYGRLTHLSHQQQVLHDAFWSDPTMLEVSRKQEGQINRNSGHSLERHTARGDFHFETKERREAGETLWKLLALEGSSSFLRAYIEGLLALTLRLPEPQGRQDLLEAMELLEALLGVVGECEDTRSTTAAFEEQLPMQDDDFGLGLVIRPPNKIRLKRRQTFSGSEVGERWRKGEREREARTVTQRCLVRQKTWTGRELSLPVEPHVPLRQGASLSSRTFAELWAKNEEAKRKKKRGGEVEVKCRMQSFKGKLGRSMLLPGIGGLMEDKSSSKRRVTYLRVSKVMEGRASGDTPKDNFYFALQNGALQILGLIYERLGKLEAAEKMLEMAAADAAKEDGLAVLPQRLVPLALVQLKRGNVRGARVSAWRALAIYEAAGPSKRVSVGQTLTVQAAAQWLSGNAEAAMKDLEIALKLLEDQLGGRHPLVGDIVSALGRLHYAQGNLGEALSLQQRALLVHGSASGSSYSGLALLLADLVCTEEAIGNREAANELRRRAFALIGQSSVPDLMVLKFELEAQRAPYEREGDVYVPPVKQ